MKLNIRALAFASAIIWGAAIFLVGTINVMSPDYGMIFLTMAGSIYPGYQPGAGFSSVIIGTGYGIVDAGIGGAIFAWLYNCLAK